MFFLFSKFMNDECDNGYFSNLFMKGAGMLCTSEYLTITIHWKFGCMKQVADFVPEAIRA